MNFFFFIACTNYPRYSSENANDIDDFFSTTNTVSDELLNNNENQQVNETQSNNNNSFSNGIGFDLDSVALDVEITSHTGQTFRSLMLSRTPSSNFSTSNKNPIDSTTSYSNELVFKNSSNQKNQSTTILENNANYNNNNNKISSNAAAATPPSNKRSLLNLFLPNAHEVDLPEQLFHPNEKNTNNNANYVSLSRSEVDGHPICKRRKTSPPLVSYRIYTNVIPIDYQLANMDIVNSNPNIIVNFNAHNVALNGMNEIGGGGSSGGGSGLNVQTEKTQRTRTEQQTQIQSIPVKKSISISSLLNPEPNDELENDTNTNKNKNNEYDFRKENNWFVTTPSLSQTNKEMTLKTTTNNDRNGNVNEDENDVQIISENTISQQKEKEKQTPFALEPIKLDDSFVLWEISETTKSNDHSVKTTTPKKSGKTLPTFQRQPSPEVIEEEKESLPTTTSPASLSTNDTEMNVVEQTEKNVQNEKVVGEKQTNSEIIDIENPTNTNSINNTESTENSNDPNIDVIFDESLSIEERQKRNPELSKIFNSSLQANPTKFDLLTSIPDQQKQQIQQQKDIQMMEQSQQLTNSKLIKNKLKSRSYDIIDEKTASQIQSIMIVVEASPPKPQQSKKKSSKPKTEIALTSSNQLNSSSKDSSSTTTTITTPITSLSALLTNNNNNNNETPPKKKKKKPKTDDANENDKEKEKEKQMGEEDGNSEKKVKKIKKPKTSIIIISESTTNNNNTISNGANSTTNTTENQSGTDLNVFKKPLPIGK